jgi:hypothetical protein
MEKAFTEAGVTNKKDAETKKAEEKSLIGPLAYLPPHHLVEEVEVEVDAEAGDPVPAQNFPPATVRVTHGNASMSTELNTSAQSALEG